MQSVYPGDPLGLNYVLQLYTFSFFFALWPLSSSAISHLSSSGSVDGFFLSRAGSGQLQLFQRRRFSEPAQDNRQAGSVCIVRVRVEDAVAEAIEQAAAAVAAAETPLASANLTAEKLAPAQPKSLSQGQISSGEPSTFPDCSGDGLSGSRQSGFPRHSSEAHDTLNSNSSAASKMAHLEAKPREVLIHVTFALQDEDIGQKVFTSIKKHVATTNSKA
ncbi:unnamed protein product [Protopolystoma xenopodis]|uniref:Uncharacterized protein n=1 Tax=Protopolystoma xenopodis TaxID=117903 RepID=A0A3S5FGZ6_9PLAT|nr:unnamed protein product [Protopolystoma xenopodis]